MKSFILVVAMLFAFGLVANIAFAESAQYIEIYDSDGDGIMDVDEVLYGTDPLDADSDDDGLTDGEEVYTYGTDPLDSDSDDGGVSDGDEVLNGTEPLDPIDEMV